MIVNIDGLDVYYEKSGRKGKKVVLLHGWGCSSELMAFIADSLKAHFIVYNIDFPGFGKTKEPSVAWDTVDYTNFLRNFCLKLKIDNPIFIGHSFGCRIALRYAYNYGAYKMCLTGAAGIRNKRTLKWYFKTYTYKLGKKILSLKLFEKYKEKFESKVGSDDYKNSSGIMRQTFVKVVNEDVTEFLDKIETETLLVYGSEDKATPLAKGKLMESLMPNATLVVFENDDHFAYIHQANRFINVLDAFLRSDY